MFRYELLADAVACSQNHTALSVRQPQPAARTRCYVPFAPVSGDRSSHAIMRCRAGGMGRAASADRGHFAAGLWASARRWQRTAKASADPALGRADSPSRRRWLRGIRLHVMSGGSPDGVDGEARNERPVTVVFWRIKLAGWQGKLSC
jgi:hypothetical protein